MFEYKGERYTLADLERLSDPAFKLEYSKKTNQVYRKTSNDTRGCDANTWQVNVK